MRVIIYTTLILLMIPILFMTWLDLSLHKDEVRWIEQASQYKMNTMIVENAEQDLDKYVKKDESSV